MIAELSITYSDFQLLTLVISLTLNHLLSSTGANHHWFSYWITKMSCYYAFNIDLMGKKRMLLCLTWHIWQNVIFQMYNLIMTKKSCHLYTNDIIFFLLKTFSVKQCTYVQCLYPFLTLKKNFEIIIHKPKNCDKISTTWSSISSLSSKC